MKAIFLLAAVAVVTGCSLQSRESFDAQPFEAATTVSRNYQAVYADVLKGARTCWGDGPVFTGSALPNAANIDAQLYSDLGYGEVYHYASGTVFLPYALIRIEREGAGAKVSVKTGIQAGAVKLFREPPLRWATGDFTCGSFKS